MNVTQVSVQKSGLSQWAAQTVDTLRNILPQVAAEFHSERAAGYIS